MQQRAAVQPTSRFEPIVENYVNFLRVTCERLGIIFTPALEEEVRRKLRQKVESEKEDPLSSAALFQRCVMVTLEALREAKKQSGDKVVVDEETARSAEEQRIRWTTLQASLSQLPETRRRAVALHLSGLAPLEIADLLQWSEAKTRKQIERGLQILRTKLQAAGIEYEID